MPDIDLNEDMAARILTARAEQKTAKGAWGVEDYEFKPPHRQGDAGCLCLPCEDSRDRVRKEIRRCQS